MFFRKETPVIRTREQHIISRKNIDPDALRVLYRLADAGHTAYLVGGSVRDLLLERKPKDFDIGTSAHPNEVRRLFRNCFLIGRRFRLAHVRFGDKVIETCTFRRQPPASEADEDVPGGLYQHSDNTFGTPEEDARRRDFTVNGLFYDIKTFSVIDYVGGLRDLDRRVLRSIGDPNVRFREDPVRMMRAVRFSARLGFQIDWASRRAIRRHYREILHAAAPRLLEEVFRLFSHQSAMPAFELLWRTRLLSVLLPEIDAYVNDTGGRKSPLWRYLEALDHAPASGDASNGLRLAMLFYPLFLQRLEEAGRHGGNVNHLTLAHAVLDPVGHRMHVPRAGVFTAAHVIDAQRNFHGRDALARRGHTSRQALFPEALAFSRMVHAAEQKDAGHLAEWERLGAEHAATRQRPHPADVAGRRDLEAPDSGAEPLAEASEVAPETDPGAPRRRRRRRPRRPVRTEGAQTDQPAREPDTPPGDEPRATVSTTPPRPPAASPL